MRDNSNDMTAILEGLEGKWVALSEKDGKFSVAGSGGTLDGAIKEAIAAGEEDPILMRVPLKNIAWILYECNQVRRKEMIKTLSIHTDDWDPLIRDLTQAGSRKKIETLLGLFVSKNWTSQDPPESRIRCHCCGTELEHVDVYSDCVQQGTLEGKRITDYSQPEVEETTGISCPECGTALRMDNNLAEEFIVTENGETVADIE